MKKSAHLVLGFLLASTVATPQQYVIETIAGGAPPPTPVAGVNASIAGVRGVATDATGSVYFSTDLACVFKLNRNGIMTLFAGNARPGFSGDGGPAIDAQLSTPGGLAADGDGSIYIADAGNHRVRRVSAAGIITTVAGNGTPGHSGDGGPATGAELFGVGFSPAAVAI